MNLSQEMRHWSLLLESENFENGIFAAAKLSQSSIDAIAAYIAAYDIPNPIPKKELHTTLIYSEKGNADFEAQDNYDSEIKATFTSFDKFGKDNEVLVMKVESDELHKRHKELMSTYNLSYNFDEYRPHITLSYDAKDFDISKLDDYYGDIIFIGEESNELDTDWEPDDDNDDGDGD